MNKTPLCSIIINNYNYGRYLGEAIDSALNQTYLNTEVIVVDDGSTDNSAEIIDSYAFTIQAIRKQNGGQASAFNVGFKASLGEVVVFLDADDVLLPTTIEKVIKEFEKPDVVKVHWPLWRIDASGMKTGHLIPNLPLAEGNLFNNLVRLGPNYCGGPPEGPPTSGNAWSRKFLAQIFPVPEKEFIGGADQYLFVLAPLFGHIRKLNEPQGCYRVHGTNNTVKPTYMTINLERFEHMCLILGGYLQKAGIKVDTSVWPRDSWYHKIRSLIKDITDLVPPHMKFILVDANSLGFSDIVAGRHRLYFKEKDGQYWGEPKDDATAIEEIERQRASGITYIIFAWTGFWLLDYYKGMYQYLNSYHECILENERLIAFRLIDS